VVKLKGRAVLISLRDMTPRLQLEQAKKQLRRAIDALDIDTTRIAELYRSEIYASEDAPEDPIECFPFLGKLLSPKADRKAIEGIISIPEEGLQQR
jgi:hypothetical protein